MNNRALEAALLLGQAREDNTGVSLPDDLIPATEEEAYAVQSLLHDWQKSEGKGTVCGYKVGCTATHMQEMLGVPNPAFGGILDSNVHSGEASFDLGGFQRAGIECELAVRLSADLPAAGAPYSRADVEAAIGSCMAAIEVVDNRYGDFLSVPATVMMADDFFHTASVLGPEVRDWRGLDLAGIEGRTFINGQLAGSGTGSEVLGHPLEAVVWLANRMTSLGRGLKAGEFISTGTMASVQWIDNAPAEAMISIDGLGDVRARFT